MRLALNSLIILKGDFVMKKVLSFFLASVIVVGMMLSLVSCGNNLSGEYKGEVNVLVASYEVIYKFSGKKVEVSRQVKSVLGNAEPVVINGTYEINEDEEGKLTISFEYEGEEDEVVKGGTYNFEKGEDYIRIGIAKYTKVD